MQRSKRINNEDLRIIRSNTDWKKLFQVLGLERDPKKSSPDDWWAKSPFTEETNPSFHINENGFYCHSSKEGGGPIELVQTYFRLRMGQTINCYEAGKWLLENDVSSLPGFSEDRSEGKKKEETIAHLKEKVEETKLENKPIRQNLIPSLSQMGEHPEFVRRGISEKTFKYLGCGYLENAKGEMKGRIIFQVRGLELINDDLSPVILTHIGRATNQEQEETGGKWKPYKGFIKTLEIYNIDKLFLDPEAIEQATQTGKVLIVEGCFDVAKLIEADIRNVVAAFGSHLAEEQIPRLKLIKDRLGDIEFLVWFDRDKAGREGQEKALALLKEQGIAANGFDWDISFPSRKRGSVKITEGIKDACEFSVEQLTWMRAKRII